MPEHTSRVIGIDLGTTNSVMAVMEGDHPVIIPNSEGGRVTPSVVAFTANGERLTGQLARRQAVLNPARTISSVKRQMGKDAPIVIDEQRYTPAQISAMILQKLKVDAEAYLGAPVTGAVITVPAYFNDAQRHATKEAGELAGLHVLRIINEPTAAALAYGMDKTRSERVLVWDLGGGTFDVSLLDAGDGVFEVRATSGDTHLGGDDYDRALVDYLAGEFQREHGIDLRRDLQAFQRLLDAAEKAKIELSSLLATTITLPFITADASGPKHLEREITRATFEALTSPLTDRTRPPFEQALSDAHVSAGDLDQVLLVGGATRMPGIQSLVRQLTNRTPNLGVNPDEVVALGAAIQAGVLTGTVEDILLLDVTPLSLGVETVGNRVHRLVERNSPLPINTGAVFTTSRDDQPDVEIHVVQGEAATATANHSLGRFQLDRLPPAPRGFPRIKVTFDIDVNGLVTVTAQDEASGHAQHITIVGGQEAAPVPDSSVHPTDVLQELFARSQPSGKQQVVDAAAQPPTAYATVRRADALIAQAVWVLENANPPLSYFERVALENHLRRLQEARVAMPPREATLAAACDELDRLRERLAQWHNAP